MTPVKKDIARRAWVVYIIFFAFGIAVLGKILYLQWGPDSGELKAQAESTRTFRMEIMEAERGDILSYDGRVLATNLPKYDLRMDFNAAGLIDSIFDSNVDSLSIRLSRLFGDRSAAQYRATLRANRARALSGGQRVYRLVSRQASYFELAEARTFPLLRIANRNISGFLPEKVNLRQLPYGSIAARTIGRRVDESVKWGIEGAFDDQLRGRDGETRMQRISGSFWIPVADDSNREPEDGADVVSTIDIELQDVAENALRQQLQAEEADWGTAILMEVATGEIRAMANLTRRADGVCVEDLNHAIYQRINPGSTFKIVPLMILLDDAGMSPDDVIDIEGGEITVRGRRIRDSHPDPRTRELTLRRIFETSSNVGFVKAVTAKYEGREQHFLDLLARMGVNDTIPFQLEGSRAPLIHSVADRAKPGPNGMQWSGQSLVSMAFGYELEMTPLHTLCIYNAVANDGRLISPVIVNGLQQYGVTTRRFESKVLRNRITSPSTLKTVQDLLAGVATEGTARSLRIKDLDIAVKTGTAQIPRRNRGYGTGGDMDYLATLAGYFPADNPRYSCIVCIKTLHGFGRGANYYGGSLAGPVFRAIAERVYGASTDWQQPLARQGKKAVDYPQVKGGDVAQVREALSKFPVSYTSSRGVRGAVAVESDSMGIALREVQPEPGRVPDVHGMGLRDALRLLEGSGMSVTFTGRGKVIGQSIKAGGEAVRGQNINITLQ